MQKVRVAGFGVSLDGFSAGIEQSLSDPLGKRGTEIFQWFFRTKTFRAMLGQEGGVAGQSGVIRRSDAMYALDAKAAIFRRAWRLLPALAAILIPASVLSKKSAMLSRSASERISLCFFALVSTRISV